MARDTARKRQRRAEMLRADARPGAILALGLLANAPVLVGFVLAPLFNAGDALAARAFVPYVLWLSGPLALASAGLYARTARERRQHRAARIGLLLAIVAFALWLLVLVLTLRAR